MKKFVLGIVVGILVTLVPSAFAIKAYPETFSDVPEGEWYEPAITTLANNQIVDGYADGTFRPGELVNRAEVAKMIYGLFILIDTRSELYYLEKKVEVLESKLSSFDFPGDCYFEESWYNAEETDETGVYTCHEDGSMTAPLPQP